MKVFDSGMPEEAYWASLFDVPAILAWLNPAAGIDPVAEIGCGYGTFTVPIARCVPGEVHAFDIEPSMIARAGENARAARLANISFHQRDVLESGTGLSDGSMQTVLLFNILHSRDNRFFLAEAARVLRESGSVRIIHWRKDIETPRGPRRDDRPTLASIPRCQVWGCPGRLPRIRSPITGACV
jgi:ubiquinone/menaquinone biosynthesis C-methylase UbiE